MLISSNYAKLNADMHARDPGYGTSGAGYADIVKIIANRIGTRSILDYGCGKCTLEMALGFDIANYDPAIPSLSAPPRPADFVVCTDVLEHIEPECLDAVLDDLKRLTKRVVFLAVSTKPATVQVDIGDGRNAHLIQEPMDWWLPKLKARFRTLRYYEGPSGFAWFGQSFGDPTSGLDLGDIGPPPETKIIRTKSAYTDEQRMANIRSSMLRCLPTVSILPKHDNTLVLACYGPSLTDTLDELRADIAKPGHDLYSVSGAHALLLREGIAPKGHVEADPRPHKAKLIGESDPRVVYFISSACDRATYEVVRGREIYVWHVTSSSPETDLIAEMDRSGRSFTIDGGTNVGMSAIGLGTVLGYRKFIVYGMDCSFKADDLLLNWPNDRELPEDIRNQIGFHAGAHPNEDQPVYRVWVDGRPFVSSPQMFQAAQDAAITITGSRDCTFELRGDGFLPALMKHIAADKAKRKAA